ncbi:MAG: transglycosylase SLT domain-containing protein, partial [Cyclobacteriaceae bacterium]|nr:transglycosylase SLT domain-containing protein [Cyclobacteriaceae bacterium]
RMEEVAFTDHLFRTKQVLVQRLPDNIQKLTRDEIEKSLIRDRLDLESKDVMVRKNSSYELILNNLVAETGLELNINYASGDLVTEHLIDMVSNKEIDFTICDQNKAEIFNAYYDNIDIQTPMSLSQPIAWAVNKESSELLSKLNSWISKRKGSLEFNMINNRYFEMTKRKERLITKEYDYVKEGIISDYDELIKKYSAELNWDWRLLTALIYQESMFNPKTKSWRGATGLMQLMPRTAQSYGIQPKELVVPEKNIIAGTQHLAMLENYWKNELTDSLEIIKFTLGSYNVGLGHVQDAIRLAEKYNVNTKKWDDNVAQMLLNKSIPKYYKDPVVKYGYCRGREPVNYVKSILSNYELYRQFTK